MKRKPRKTEAAPARTASASPPPREPGSPAATTPPSPSGGFVFGKTFVSPAFDLLTIGGGLGIIVAFGLWFSTGRQSVDGATSAETLARVILLANMAHFAASTVRLYTKPAAFSTYPFLTMGFPIVALAVATLGVVFHEHVARHLFALYLTWSPYHYSAQAYGLGMMYCYRSGLQPTMRERNFFRAGCLTTFAMVMISSPNQGIGVWWIVPWSAVSDVPAIVEPIRALRVALAVLAFALPIGLYLHMRTRGRSIPLIAMSIVLSNSVWFVAFPAMQAVMWTTVFHGIQYIAIVAIFHAKDWVARPGNRLPAIAHAAWFYAACVVMGYALFRVWPKAYVAMGLGGVESALVVAAAINLHHFIVDGYIWKLRKDPNYRIVADALPA